MTKQMKNAIFFPNLYINQKSFKKNTNTLSTLTDIAASRNLHSPKCIRLAEEIMREVQRYEALYTMVEDDTCKTMQSFFRSLETYTPQKRVAILDEMVFAMELFGDEVLLAEAEEKGFDKVFRPAPADLVYDDSLQNEMNLKERLMEQVQKMNLSPLALHRISHQMKKSPTAANAYALSKDSFQLKCTAAMYLYLENQHTMTVSEAVAHACSDIYMQAAADAVYIGDLAEKAALAVVAVTAVVSTIFLAHFFMTYTPGHAILSIVAAIYFGTKIHKFLAPSTQYAGEMAVFFAQLLRDGKETITAGFAKIREYVWRQCSADMRHRVELEMMEEIWNEEMMQDTFLDEEEEVFA